MATPIGHSLAGLVIFSYYRNTINIKKINAIILYVFAANAPDLDFVPGFLIGQPNLYHHGFSHSFGAALFFSCLAAIFITKMSPTNFWTGFLICFTLYSSHLLLDFIAEDRRPPLGIPLFWPLSNEYYILSNQIFPGINHSSLDHATIKQFFDDAFSKHNLYVILLEMLVILPFLFVTSLVKTVVIRNNILKKKNETK